MINNNIKKIQKGNKIQEVVQLQVLHPLNLLHQTKVSLLLTKKIRNFLK